MPGNIYENGEAYLRRITAGLRRDEAVEAFLAACNRRDTLFVTERWLAEKLQPIREHLSDPIHDDEALVLRELAQMRVKSDEVIGWLREKTTSWAEYHERFTSERGRERHQAFSRALMTFPWDDVEASADDHNLQQAAADEHGEVRRPGQMVHCPVCQGSLLRIFFRSPAWTWQKMCGRAGWLAICRTCRIQADFEMTSMN